MIGDLATGLEIETDVVDLPLFTDKTACVFVVLVMFPGRVLPGEARTREIDHRLSSHASGIRSLRGNRCEATKHYRIADTDLAND